jgi:hypothetical protein
MTGRYASGCSSIKDYFSESGARAGYDAAKGRRGSKVHMAVDTLGQLLALRVTPADEDDRAQVGEVIQAVQALAASRWKWPTSSVAG